MIFPRVVMTLTALTFAFCAGASPVYRVPCLERIAQAVGLQLSDTLGINMDNDSTWNYNGRPLRVCTNTYGDVSHIGYRLFDSRWAATYDIRPLLDFIERYALEEDIVPYGDKAEAVSRKAVTFLQGDAALLKTLMPDIPFSISERERRAYHVEWGTEDGKVSFIVSADYQCMLGANLIELEDMLERDLCRCSSETMPDTLPSAWKAFPVSISEKLAIVDGGTFLGDLIRSRLFLQADDDGIYHILCDNIHIRESINNILLTGSCGGRSIPLRLTLDRYGNVKREMTLTFQQFVRYCETEGCRLYLGVKEQTDTDMFATIFAVNDKLAYCHTLSLSVPFSLLRGEGCITGTLYAFTPLQNITEKFFINP